MSTLRAIFSEYGTIIDIVAKHSLKRRGQAFIVFDKVESATRAIEDVQGFELFDKPMVLEYAKTKSDALVQLQGDKGEFERHRRSRLAEKGTKRFSDLLLEDEEIIWLIFILNRAETGT